MAEKKGQHLVPVCYLKSFIADDIEELKRVNRHIEAGIYVNSKKLDLEWKMKGVNNTLFKKSYYYNLPEDNPENPCIENYLASIESKFIKKLRKIESREIDNDVMSFFSHFMILQYIRVEKYMNETQHIWNEVSKWCDKFSGGSQYEQGFKDIIKRQILFSDSVVLPDHVQAHIIFNNTNLRFITSDNPVVKKNLNRQDISLVVPNSIISQNRNNSYESIFFFYPLTPKIAYLSSDLLNSEKIIEFDETNLKNIFFLNYWSIMNANKYVFSSVKDPIKCESELSKFLNKSKDVSYIKIYTENQRFILKGYLASTDRNQLSLILDSREEFYNLKLGDQISLIEVIEDGSSVRGMRSCSIVRVDSNKKLIVIESNFKI